MTYMEEVEAEAECKGLRHQLYQFANIFLLYSLKNSITEISYWEFNNHLLCQRAILNEFRSRFKFKILSNLRIFLSCKLKTPWDFYNLKLYAFYLIIYF